MVPALVTLGIFVASIDWPAANALSRQDSSKPGLPEPLFYKELSLAAESLGIDLFVFSPRELGKHEITGFRYREERWVQGPCPLPDILYDRCYYRSLEERDACRKAVIELAARKPFIPLSSSLPSKWEVYQAFAASPVLLPYLPPTTLYDRSTKLNSLIERYPSRGLFLKPAAGMQGKGAMHVKRCLLEQRWHASGRTRLNERFQHSFDQYTALEQWVSRFIGSAAYIVQPYLDLNDADGKPFDVRALVQKNERGRWSLTGTAVRAGQSGSLTSNLHGGGTAYGANEQLRSQFGLNKAEQLLKEINELTLYAVDKLENSFGRFAELGFDYGIEQDGRLWLLEVNSKPGRSSFRQLDNKEAAKLSIEQPLHYARLLSRRLFPPFITNESAIGRLPYPKKDRRLRSDNVQEVHP